MMKQSDIQNQSRKKQLLKQWKEILEKEKKQEQESKR